MHEEVALYLSSSPAAGSEYWKLTAGFRNLPGIGAMTAVDGAGLLRRLQKIIRNKVQKLRRQEEKGNLDESSSLQRPTSIHRAQRAREAADRSIITSSLEIDKLITELEDIWAGDGETTDVAAGMSEEGNRGDEPR